MAEDSSNIENVGELTDEQCAAIVKGLFNGEDADIEEYNQYDFIEDLLESEDFQYADSIVIAYSVADDTVVASWGGSRHKILGLVDLAKDRVKHGDRASSPFSNEEIPESSTE